MDDFIMHKCRYVPDNAADHAVVRSNYVNFARSNGKEKSI